MLPLTTLDQFLSGMPYVTFSIPGKDVILIQPSSTILVYLLGLIMIAIGVYFLVTKKPAVTILLGYRINRRGHQCNCRWNELSGFRLRIKIPRLGALSVCQ
jgi:hypothetical protein